MRPGYRDRAGTQQDRGHFVAAHGEWRILRAMYHSPERRYGQESPLRRFGSGMLLFGSMSVLFGLAILAAPDLLAYLVASFFIAVGASLLLAWYRIRS
jgi:hypothetical protein